MFTEKKLMRSGVFQILQKSDNVFSPSLTESGIDISSYSEKLCKFASFIVSEDDYGTSAYLAFYKNYERRQLYIPLLCVFPDHQHKGLGTMMIEYLRNEYKVEYKTIALEVLKQNENAYEFYKKLGFGISEDRGAKFLMTLKISREAL